MFATCKNTCPGGETETHVNFVIQTFYFSELPGCVRWEDVTIISLILSIYIKIFVNIEILTVFVNHETIVTLCLGGFALLAASGAVAQAVGAAGLGAAGFAPILGGLGLAAVGGMGLMAMNECSAPLCIADNGQCCLLAMDSRGIVCPLSC